MSAPTYKRRTYYIKNSAQSKFIFRFILLSAMGGIAALAAFNFLAYKKIDTLLYSMRLPNASPGGLLWREMLYTNLSVIVFMLVAFALTAKGLFTRVHGPLKKMTNDITRMANGELNFAISLRNQDEFRDVAEDLNRMATDLNHRFSHIQQLADDILDETQTSQPAPDKLRSAIAALHTATKTFTV